MEYYFEGATVPTIRTVLRLTPPQVSPTFNYRPTVWRQWTWWQASIWDGE